MIITVHERFFICFIYFFATDAHVLQKIYIFCFDFDLKYDPDMFTEFFHWSGR